MYLCYIDESGTPEIPGTTSHYVLAGLAIPIYHWKDCENEINRVKKKYNLLTAEIHTGWLIKNYTEQNKIPGFVGLSYSQRAYEVQKYRTADLLKLQADPKGSKKLKQTKKSYNQTRNYILNK